MPERKREGVYDVIVIGAGAAGLMCAITAGKRGRSVWLIDHSAKIGEKIRISGGGRCNFTNLNTRAEAFISGNPHFCKSALAGFKPQDFIALMEKHGLAYHEKNNGEKYGHDQKLGQLFCDTSAQDIIDMLVRECESAGVQIDTGTTVNAVSAEGESYNIETSRGAKTCTSLVIATGGLSIPKIGATKFGYEIARQFGLKVRETLPALVPLTFQDELLEHCKTLSGVSVDALVSCGKTKFREGLLFTHRGLSGPSILQISSYWRAGNEITVNLAPDTNIENFLKEQKEVNPRRDASTVLSQILPARLVDIICTMTGVDGRLADLSHKSLETLATGINHWQIKPSGSEGYRTAEVTLQGVDTDELSSKTMEAKAQKGLYFIGEVVDVTGHLGGYNFQWAWASGHAAGQSV